MKKKLSKGKGIRWKTIIYSIAILFIWGLVMNRLLPGSVVYIIASILAVTTSVSILFPTDFQKIGDSIDLHGNNILTLQISNIGLILTLTLLVFVLVYFLTYYDKILILYEEYAIRKST